MCGQCSFGNDSLRQRDPLTTKHPGIPTPPFFFFVHAWIKCWSTCCPSGYCIVQSVAYGFKLDKKLRPHENCPLGRTARTLLYVALEACPEFSTKIVISGVTIAMDNYFTSAALLLALATRDIFVVGTSWARYAATGADWTGRNSFGRSTVWSSLSVGTWRWLERANSSSSSGWTPTKCD